MLSDFRYFFKTRKTKSTNIKYKVAICFNGILFRVLYQFKYYQAFNFFKYFISFLISRIFQVQKQSWDHRCNRSSVPLTLTLLSPVSRPRWVPLNQHWGNQTETNNNNGSQPISTNGTTTPKPEMEPLLSDDSGNKNDKVKVAVSFQK